ncbi:8-hydroxyquercetin 8-O-methyltransferase [Morus notabilis]|uniref:8-hydroxyquercetin 8-O-methyltransferase n=1 Tax=Morus notabilis TaxID=981085 RepID=W9RF01_9ROSA|nr:probable O-methyltransferase 3 [Morus notabilis]EXB67905.1 8-hydroxyquercetin 8-O-methyltransferase [Morus notabilis]
MEKVVRNSGHDLEIHSTELVKAQAHIWNYIFNFINSMSLKCAVQLGIPDAIHSHGKPMTLSQLISALPIHQNKKSDSRLIYRLMRILVNSGFFVLQEVVVGETDLLEEGYVLTTASKLLLRDNPLSVTPLLLSMLDPIMTKPWHSLSTWLQSDDPTPFAATHGMGIWDYNEYDPRLGNLFNEAMASDARLVTSVLIDKCKSVLEGLESLVDLAGGTGTVAKAIAYAFPHLACTVFDLPHVIADLQGSKNLKFVGGDMFDEIPPADAIFMKWILHDWSDEDCVKLLERCKVAITCKGNKNGKVILVDMVIVEEQNNKDIGHDHHAHDHDHQSYETQLFFDMLMMVLYPGRERKETEWAKLFSDAGFNTYKITPILGVRSLIEVFP